MNKQQNRIKNGAIDHQAAVKPADDHPMADDDLRQQMEDFGKRMALYIGALEITDMEKEDLLERMEEMNPDQFFAFYDFLEDWHLAKYLERYDRIMAGELAREMAKAEKKKEEIWNGARERVEALTEEWRQKFLRDNLNREGEPTDEITD